MMPDIFSSFDPMIASYILPSLTLIFILLIILSACMSSWFWTLRSRNPSLSLAPHLAFFSNTQTTQTHMNKTYTLTTLTIFFTLITMNLFGLSPYSFSSSSHLALTLSLGLPLWLTMIISSFFFDLKSSTAHLLPEGAPGWLSPFLVLIECISITLRPITLSFRLAANMTAGHILLSLMTSIFTPMSLSTAPAFLFSSFFIGFEFAICIIQAYIFSLLLTLYTNDHAN